MNWRGMYTLFYREVWRFFRVIIQTLMAPAITALLYLWVFGHLLGDRLAPFDGMAYTTYLVPGLVMMSVIQNAFANTSSSIMQSKLQGNLAFVLMAPLSNIEFFLALVGASVARGVLVALAIYSIAWITTPLLFEHVFLLMLVVVLASILLGALGLLAGLWADRIENLAAFQSFVIMPFSFLSGVFYSIHSLPEGWQTFSLFNPFFYMIDIFRYASLGTADIPYYISLLVLTISCVIISGFTILVLKSGYKLRP